MKQKNFKLGRIKKEIEVSTARSGGPGGQHVNKVETKVILRFNVPKSEVLSAAEKSTILTVLGDRLTKSGDLLIQAANHSSQIKNKELAFKKLHQKLSKAFEKPKLRKKTKPTRAAQMKRLQSKKLQGQKKQMRQRPISD